jgi:radical SAM protein with 4Fe4S-binding SPASM domain
MEPDLRVWKNIVAPIDLTIEITRKCSLNCLICSSEAGVPYLKELTAIEIKKIIEDAKQLGCQNVCFSGGEPFGHPDIVDFCRYSRSLGLKVQIYTSGNILGDSNSLGSVDEKTLIEIKPFVSKIIIGLQGPTPEVHESITRVAGSFDNAILSIKRAVEQSLLVEIHFVPVKSNYKFIPDLIELSKKLGITKVSILRFVPQGRGKVYHTLLNLNEAELIELKSILSTIAKSEMPVVRVGAPFSVLGLSKARCTAGENRATIRADGLVFPCEALKQMSFSSNDLKLQNLKEIWEQSQMFRDARNFSLRARNGACAKCNNLDVCGGGCPAQSLSQRNSSSGCLDPYCPEKEVVLIDVKQ